MTSKRAFVPDRGDIIWIAMSPQSGREQAGRRPALVLSPSSYNGKTGLAVLCPITSRVTGYPFEVPLPPGAAMAGVVLADQVRSLDWRARDAAPLERAPGDVLEEVIARLSALLLS